MHTLPHLRALTSVPLLLGLVFTAGPLTAGLDGEAVVNNEPAVTGQTTLAAEVLDLQASDALTIVVNPGEDPPTTIDFPIGSSRALGTMESYTLSASGNIVDDPYAPFTQSSAIVDFADKLVVTAEGIAPGTEIIVEVAWQVSGNTEINSPDTIPAIAQILLQADGVDLDPDPNAPAPPPQVWKREISNRFVGAMDPPGQVKFEFLVEAGPPADPNAVPENIRIRSAAGVQCGPAFFGQQFNSSATSDLNVDLIGVTNVKTTDGRTLYRWQTAAGSLLDYGERDDDPPSNPLLTVGPSAGGPAFDNLSWDTVLGEFYFVQTTTDNSTWSTVTEVLGTGSTVEIDLFKDDSVLAYRLLPEFGSGTPSPQLVTPRLRILPIRDGGPLVRVAWQTNHWELYSLREIDSAGGSSLLESASGDGGVVWFDFTPTFPGQLFQVSAVLK